jgi:hypothetical protein
MPQAQPRQSPQGSTARRCSRASGIMRALNRHVERVFYPDRKDSHWRKRKLARDRCLPGLGGMVSERFYYDLWA